MSSIGVSEKQQVVLIDEYNPLRPNDYRDFKERAREKEDRERREKERQRERDDREKEKERERERDDDRRDRRYVYTVNKRNERSLTK